MPDRATTTGARGPVRRVRADLLGLRLFDHRWYRGASGRSGRKVGLYRHFLADGWRDGLDPNGWFSCTGYLRANPDVAESGFNPWLHFVRSGRHEQRPLCPDAQPTAEIHSMIGPLTLEDTLVRATQTLVDETFYLGANPDVEATGLSAAEHFAAYGWQEGRAPAPWFNVEYLRTHAPIYRLGSGNPLVDLLRVTTGAPPPAPAPTSWWVDPDHATRALRGLCKTADVLVIIHAYYPQDLDVFTKYIRRLGSSVQVVMTCPGNAAALCKKWVERNHLDATIVETINRGRDWGPFLAVASEIGRFGWDTILKLHTKRSPHREDGAAWLQYVLEGLLPDEQVVSRVHKLLVGEQNDLLAAPGTLSSAMGWQPEGRVARGVYSLYVDERDEFRFPAGSMFWMSGRLMVALAELPFGLADFEPELGQLDGTLAHMLERLVAMISPTKVALVATSSGPSTTATIRAHPRG